MNKRKAIELLEKWKFSVDNDNLNQVYMMHSTPTDILENKVSIATEQENYLDAGIITDIINMRKFHKAKQVGINDPEGKEII